MSRMACSVSSSLPSPSTSYFLDIAERRLLAVVLLPWGTPSSMEAGGIAHSSSVPGVNWTLEPFSSAMVTTSLLVGSLNCVACLLASLQVKGERAAGDDFFERSKANDSSGHLILFKGVTEAIPQKMSMRTRALFPRSTARKLLGNSDFLHVE